MDCSLPGSPVYGILRTKYWSEWPRPPPGNLPDPGIESKSLMSPALAGGFLTTSATWEAPGGVTEKNKSDSILDLFLQFNLCVLLLLLQVSH